VNGTLKLQKKTTSEKEKRGKELYFRAFLLRAICKERAD